MQEFSAAQEGAPASPACRIRLNCANPACGREFEARPKVGNREEPKCCSARCRNDARIARLVAQGVEAVKQRALDLGGSGVAKVPSSALPPVKERVDEASGADPEKSSVRDVAQPPPHSRRRKQTGTAIRLQILDLMGDGNEWTVWQLAERCGCMETTASAKLRDLRKAKHGAWIIHGRRLPDSAAYTYRLIGQQVEG